MKLVEAYTPVQIRACGRMIDSILSKGESIDTLRELAKILTIQADSSTSKFRLYIEKPANHEVSNEDYLMAIGYGNLQTLKYIEKSFSKRSITKDDVDKVIKRLRKIEFDSTDWGRVRAG